MLSGGEKARRAVWDQIRKSLKCQAKSFVGRKEEPENFKGEDSELGLFGNSEQDELGSKDIMWKLVNQSRGEVAKSFN